MPIKNNTRQNCILMIIADGFEESETILLLKSLREAGLWVQTISLTSGLVSSTHGVWLKADLTMMNIEHLLNTTTIRLVIIPSGGQNLSKVKTDPRVHRLLGQVVARQGQIVVSSEGLSIPRTMPIETGPLVNNEYESSIILRDPAIPIETFAVDLIRRMEG